MVIAKVIGTVVSTQKHPVYVGRKTLLCQPLTPAGEPRGDEFIAVDSVDAGVGETVLVVREGNSARQVVGVPNAPILSVIVGIIDEIHVEPGTV